MQSVHKWEKRKNRGTLRAPLSEFFPAAGSCGKTGALFPNCCPDSYSATPSPPLI